MLEGGGRPLRHSLGRGCHGGRGAGGRGLRGRGAFRAAAPEGRWGPAKDENAGSPDRRRRRRRRTGGRRRLQGLEVRLAFVAGCVRPQRGIARRPPSGSLRTSEQQGRSTPLPLSGSPLSASSRSCRLHSTGVSVAASSRSSASISLCCSCWRSLLLHTLLNCSVLMSTISVGQVVAPPSCTTSSSRR